ncbi:hypothetical protein QR680_014002 [Steinernema hermaphroditum]|uniref:Uncharacterized protein n=1 Tax=Steinernema hermaphroditum TaxID=289476 RepID=A0AA39I9G7_9BILA|nr:hypothetical protein QR680_014002 [Steinernema hermaphroditum]
MCTHERKLVPIREDKEVSDFDAETEFEDEYFSEEEEEYSTPQDSPEPVFVGLATKDRRTPGENLAIVLLMILNFPLELIIFVTELLLGFLPPSMQNDFRVIVRQVVLLVPDLTYIAQTAVNYFCLFACASLKIASFFAFGWVCWVLCFVNFILEMIAVELLYVDRWNHGVKDEEEKVE